MIASLIKLLRPHQWTKNLFCLAGLVFGNKLSDAHLIANGLKVFLVFCAASSCVYVINDICDIERDRTHPKKCKRPLAAGKISIRLAQLVALMLGFAAILGGYFLGNKVLACLCLYGSLNLAYSMALKHMVFLDVACIGIGFILRLLGGVYAVSEVPTAWITLCTFFLALFLGFSKRRTELAQILDPGTNQRPVLTQYTLPLLDSIIQSTATMTIMCYALFTTISGKNPSLIITVPVVHYGIMRYKLLLLSVTGAEEPDRILLKDTGIRTSVFLWVLIYLTVIYLNPHLFR